MIISGIQKLSMVDWPGRAVATLFTGGCNFRCPFCHNFELVTESEALPGDDIFAYLEKRRGLLDGVCISGGEPTLHRDLPELINRIRDMGYGVKLDTNGTNPIMLKSLLDNKALDYVAMDIKHAPSQYSEAAGVIVNLDGINESIALLMMGDTDFEFRTTVAMGLHDSESLREIGRWIRGGEKYFLQKYTRSDNVPENSFREPTAAEMEGFLSIIKPFLPNSALRGL